MDMITEATLLGKPSFAERSLVVATGCGRSVAAFRSCSGERTRLARYASPARTEGALAIAHFRIRIEHK